VSLKAWTGDIDPYDSLDEMWIQISAIPPPLMDQLENF
jgi:hypothetical protein